MAKITKYGKNLTATMEDGSKVDLRCIMSLQKLKLAELVEVSNALTPDATVKNFKDKGRGLKRVMTSVEDVMSAKKAAPKAEQPVSNTKVPGCCAVVEIKKPRKAMFRTIRKIAEHPGQGLRVRRWELYKDGMTIEQIMRTEGICAGDVKFYVQNGLMEYVDPSNED